jgi:hypothetical protein
MGMEIHQARKHDSMIAINAGTISSVTTWMADLRNAAIDDHKITVAETIRTSWQCGNVYEAGRRTNVAEHEIASWD